MLPYPRATFSTPIPIFNPALPSCLGCGQAKAALQMSNTTAQRLLFKTLVDEFTYKLGFALTERSSPLRQSPVLRLIQAYGECLIHAGIVTHT